MTLPDPTFHLRVPLLYAILSGIYIWISDTWLFAEAPAHEAVLRASLLKGFSFIAVTTLLLAVLLRFYTARLQRQQLRTEQVYRSSMIASQHLLRNFLNEAQIIRYTLEESDHPEAKEALQSIDDATDSLVAQLDELGRLKDVTSEKIRTITFGDVRPGVKFFDDPEESKSYQRKSDY